MAELDPIYAFLDLNAVIDPSASTEGLLASVRELAADLVGQGGVQDIGSRYVRDRLDG